MIADIRITIGARTIEGILKIHQVGRWLAVGFAGNVEAGFMMVDDLRHYLSEVPDEAMVRPGFITWHWARRVRYAYRRLPERLRRGGCELLLVGASPPEKSPFSITHGYILRAPEFGLEIIPPQKARSIGSGSKVPEYVAALEGLFATRRDAFEIMQFETHRTGGSLWALSMSVSDAIEQKREASVSEHLVLCFVRAGEVLWTNNDREVLTPGTAIASRTMPPIATNLADFRVLAGEHRFAAADAVA